MLTYFLQLNILGGGRSIHTYGDSAPILARHQPTPILAGGFAGRGVLQHNTITPSIYINKLPVAHRERSTDCKSPDYLIPSDLSTKGEFFSASSMSSHKEFE